jgi:hypothetical protein
MALGRPFPPVKTERNNSLPGKLFRVNLGRLSGNVE